MNGIKVCKTRAGLASIEEPDTELVIWQRSFPSGFQDWIDKTDAASLPDVRILVKPDELRRALEPLLDDCGLRAGVMRFIKCICRYPLDDIGLYSLYRLSVIKGIPLRNGIYRFITVLLWLNGARVKEVPIEIKIRKYGTSKFNYGKSVSVFVSLVYVVWVVMTKRRTQTVHEARAKNVLDVHITRNLKL